MRFKLFNCKSPYSVGAFAFAILGCLTLIIALSSPYWLVSNPDSGSNFVRLGLWNVCFKEYRHPSLKFDSIFDGCYSFHGHRSETIRNLLQPGWFVLVQCLTTCATLLSALSICLLAYMTLQVEREIKIFVSAFVFVLEALSALLAFLGACVFGAMSFERSWIQFPKSNSLSWGYGFVVLSAILLCTAAGCLLVHVFRMRRNLYRNNILYHIPVSYRI
ncbi:uncharacterized protein [Parasteatoda tepidariorum]|nr:uncharacterized protein LOC107440818 [Parasteatoda tepidariorum]